MCEQQLCFRLMRSLDAAFCGIPFEQGDPIGFWGRDVLEAWQNGPVRPQHSRGIIRQIALDVLQGITCECPCQGLAEGVLYNPERFLRAVVVLASRHSLPPIASSPAVFH